MNQTGKYLSSFQRKLLLKDLQTQLPNSRYRNRIRIMLLADAGWNKVQICQALHCTPETARYWIAQAENGQAQNWKKHPFGRPKTTSVEYLTCLQKLLKCSPRDYGYPFEEWTGQVLSDQLDKKLGIKISPRHVNRLIKQQLGISKRKKSVSQNSVQVNNILSKKIVELDLS